MKLKLALFGALAALFLLLMASAVMAQEGVPAPYARLKNPFPWDDAAVQEAGKGIYQRSCTGCHGIGGGNIADADFSAAGFPQELEAEADFYFWILTEGALSKGMPPFKSSLSDEQRWQVLTYMHSLGTAAAVPAPAQPPPEVTGGSLTLAAPQQAQAGQSITLTAILKDKEGKPVAGAPIQFFLKEDFFASGLMKIGQATTNSDGTAVLKYTPRQSGDAEIVARYDSAEAFAAVNLAEADAPFYHAEAGIHLPAPGDEVFVGPESSRDLGQAGNAPTSAFRLPGGIVSWLLLVVAAIILIWFTYFRVLYQVFRIPQVTEADETNTRVVPLIGMAVVVILGIVLALMVLIGPYSHFHLSP